MVNEKTCGIIRSRAWLCKTGWVIRSGNRDPIPIIPHFFVRMFQERFRQFHQIELIFLVVPELRVGSYFICSGGRARNGGAHYRWFHQAGSSRSSRISSVTCRSPGGLYCRPVAGAFLRMHRYVLRHSLHRRMRSIHHGWFYLLVVLASVSPLIRFSRTIITHMRIIV